jgi:osomolarity two-component system response regulator SSK1
MTPGESSDIPSERNSLDSNNLESGTHEGRSSEEGLARPVHEEGRGTDQARGISESVDDSMLQDALDGEEHDEEGEEDAVPPIFTRSYSSPLPSRVKSFQRPSRLSSSPLTSTPPPLSHSVSQRSENVTDVVTPTALQTLSAELSDSLQSAIQTLLHLSPPHLLDNAKEQYSGCTVQLPTTSLSALLTAMKGLNYLSANVAALCQDVQATNTNLQSAQYWENDQPRITLNGDDVKRPERQDTGITGILDAANTDEDFDIGELLQSTADLLSGQAAQAGVELVLFHGDVGIKHVSVHGDGEGLGYALSYVSQNPAQCVSMLIASYVSQVLRQIINVCEPGDTLEFGLQLVPQSPSLTPRINQPLTAADLSNTKSSMRDFDSGAEPGMTLQTNKISGEGPLLCTFDIVHNCTGQSSRKASAAITPRAEAPMEMDSTTNTRREPAVDSLLCRRILRHVNATLRTRAAPEDPSYFAPASSGTFRGKTYELSVLLARGEPIAEPTELSQAEQAERQPFPQLQLAREPTLDELSRFTDTLRGKRVEVHASLRSVFARHLSSYLAAWGMEISHFPIEKESSELPAKAAVWREEMNASATTPTGAVNGISDVINAVAADPLGSGSISGERFIIIDDDVSVLKKQLLLLRAETPLMGTRTRNLKRPTLSARTRSSPQVRQLGHNLNLGQLPGETSNTVIIHFTSLAKYNHVRDVISGILAISPGSIFKPEVMVIPKPVGPRRFLTALHTAVKRPLIDPFFSPIATSPRSPGGYFTPTNPGAKSPYEQSALGPPGSISPGVELGPRRNSGPWPNIEVLPGMGSTTLQAIANTPGIVSTPASEYFQERSALSDNSRASGVVLSSPDGRAYGMFFEPQIRLESSRRNSIGNKNDKRRTPLSRSVSAASGVERGPEGLSGGGGSPRRTSNMSTASSIEGESRRLSALQTVEEDDPNSTEGDMPGPSIRPGSIRKKTLTRPQDPLMRDRSGSGSTAPRPRSNIPSVATQPETSEVGSVSVAIESTKVDATATKKKELGIKRKALIGKKVIGKKETMVVPPINVLIVEDNPINQNILSTYLRKKKIKHESANDGREAVEKWSTGNFHIILVSRTFRGVRSLLMFRLQMDIQLPVMSGLEATKMIRDMERSSNVGFFPSTPNSEARHTLSPAINTTPGTPMRSSVIIVALTASSLMQDRVEALAAGCNDFLTKPVSLKWLESKIIEWGCMQVRASHEEVSLSLADTRSRL